MLTGALQITGNDIFTPGKTKLHPYGSLGVDQFGDLYRYAKLAADVSAGYLLVSLGREANHQDMALSIAAAIGAKSVSVTAGATAVDANEYDEGYLAFSDVAPEGHVYRVVSHDTSAGSAAFIVNLDRGLIKAATTASQATLVRNPWNSPAVSQLIAERAAGVTMTDVDVSEAAYVWLKTKGVAPVLADTTGATVGHAVTISNQTNGAVGLYSDVDAEIIVGQAMQTSTATEFNPIWLTIDA